MMSETQQLLLFPIPNRIDERKTEKEKRYGTFVDNMKLPVHRWFRYSAGFSAEWVEKVIKERCQTKPDLLVLDPFVGSGTTLLAADRIGVSGIGVEAHPFVVRVAQAKLFWATSVNDFVEKAGFILNDARDLPFTDTKYPKLIHRCFDETKLTQLDQLRRAWIANNDASPSSELVWLAITAILRPTSSAGTAQWQYILPNKTKKVVFEPFEAFQAQIRLMQSDMQNFQEQGIDAKASLLRSDARSCPEVKDNSIDLVITSPPYANNYDYADATRFEMSFWGEVGSWGDLHDAVRQYLMRSSSQHASKEKLVLEEILNQNILSPIYDELVEVCQKLGVERLSHGGKKHYHTMIAAYFFDMARVWHELRRICRSGAKICFVIGDSAPYGVYTPVDKWLGQLAVAAGFSAYRFEKLRDRNIKWKNRKHRVPLHEGYLWVED